MSDEQDGGAGKARGVPLQFDKAEFGGAGAGPAGAQPCAMCATPTTGTYYEVAGRVVCPSCRDKVVEQLEEGAGASRFVKAAALGAGAALIGALGWFLIIKITDLNLGLVAIAVGWLVGRGVAKGSGGRGGWAYQALALFLTYASIGGAFLPLAIGASMESKAQKPEAALSAAPAASDDGNVAPAAEAVSPPADAPDARSGSAPPLSLGGFLFALVTVTLSLPFLIGMSSPLSGLIFAFALWQAWKLNRRTSLAIAGPYQRSFGTPPASTT